MSVTYWVGVGGIGTSWAGAKWETEQEKEERQKGIEGRMESGRILHWRLETGNLNGRTVRSFEISGFQSPVQDSSAFDWSDLCQF